ncbi:MAG: radical SAM/SPASM domain-containing protein [Pseudomonadota bacterium]
MIGLPLVTLYLTDRCNSRCVTCDYWRHGRDNLTLEALQRLLPDLVARGTRVALLSGGEPLLNRQWREIADALRARDISLWLLTSGLSLAKHAHDAARVFEAITVSLDGTTPSTYEAIRGLDAFDKVCAGVRAATAEGVRVGLRVTVQRANYRELPRFVSLARELGANQVSFLAVDVSNPHAFGRNQAFADNLALAGEDLQGFAGVLDDMENEFAAEFASGFIAESPSKLRRLQGYFAALRGQGEFPSVRCNAPEFSAVIGVDGRVSPCFFIPGPAPSAGRFDLGATLESQAMQDLRADIRAGRRRECERCVCTLWREPGELQDAQRLLRVRHG